MSYEATVGYLQAYNTAIETGAPIPGVGDLTAAEANRVTNFLMLAAPLDRVRASRRATVRTAVAASAIPEVITGSIGGDNVLRLEEFATRLQAPQEGER